MATKNPKKPAMHDHFFRMWPRALFHFKKGKEFLEQHLNGPGVYVLYRNEEPYYIGKTSRPLIKRLRNHALRPNARRYNFWNYFSAFHIPSAKDRDEVEAILISAMPTANSAQPKLNKTRLNREMCKLLNDVQSMMLTGAADTSGERNPELAGEDEG